MLRCNVKYRLEDSVDILEKSLIMKTMPSEEGKKREMLMETNVFETEIKMFTETLPTIERILAENGEPTKLAAK